MGQTRAERTWPTPRRAVHAWARIDPRHPLAPPVPCLVLEWRRRSHLWEARIVALTPDDVLLQLWVPAERLRPVRADPNEAWRS